MLFLYAVALPLAKNLAATNSSDSDLFDPTTGKCVDINRCRTVPGILYSCLSVVFICIWVAIHPNVPEVGKHRAVVVYQNLQLMLVALLAPELIIMWAMRQRFSAKRIAKKYKKYGWGMPHAFLLLMGGFALYDEDEFCGYLWEGKELGLGDWPVWKEAHEEYWRKITRNSQKRDVSVGWPEHLNIPDSNIAEQEKNEEHAPMPESDKVVVSDNELPETTCLLEYLIVHGHITITEDEIKDNLSHGDIISKSIAIIQTTWFLLQVIGRWAEGLAITELEIVTVAFALLNFGTYFLWWNKPLRVQHPVHVYWCQKKWKCNSRTMESTNGCLGAIWGGIAAIFKYVWKKSINSISELVVALMLFPLVAVLQFLVMSNDILADKADSDGSKIRFFTGLKDSPLHLYAAMYIISALFGAIHCIPWAFQFPTYTEQLLWHISAIAVAAGPIPTGSLHWAMKTKKDRNWNMPTWLSILLVVFTILLPSLYAAARTILIVLALTALRDLPPSGYQTVQWTILLPHIG
ncbi:hypothetical protein Moror_5993 [Moniliophthora roreri MCA 2997]|uniref:Uncharacterized protein n=2 Tax=Moniliophthora roreri TaxID=221103 RepID=V2WUR8_MONRO|nr:hypothetical protein Moror_5993 [Moniliophthora roreri MCA 2997]